MALTLAQAQPLSQSKLSNVVVDEFRKSALLDKLIFDDNATSNGGASFTYTYNRITTQPTAASRVLNDDYNDLATLTEQASARLGILGGRFGIDRALAANEHKVVDLIKFQLEQKAKATVAEFHNQFINGDAAQDPDVGEFDGLDLILAGAGNQVITIAGNLDLNDSTAITNNAPAFADFMRRARARLMRSPDVWLMNNDMYAVWQSIMDRLGINTATKAEYGYEVSQWGPSMVMPLGDAPGGNTPIIPTSGVGLTSIYGVCLGLDGVHGVAPAGQLIKTYLPNFQYNSNPVQDGEVEMIAGIAVKALSSIVRIDNLLIA
jgi:hypothetical protein